MSTATSSLWEPQRLGRRAAPLTGDATADVCVVLRSTTTMVHALHAGVDAIYPVCEVEQALLLAEELKGNGQATLLGGERKGRAIAGFDMGNSPSAYEAQNCQGRDRLADRRRLKQRFGSDSA